MRKISSIGTCSNASSPLPSRSSPGKSTPSSSLREEPLKYLSWSPLDIIIISYSSDFLHVSLKETFRGELFADRFIKGILEGVPCGGQLQLKGMKKRWKCMLNNCHTLLHKTCGNCGGKLNLRCIFVGLNQPPGLPGGAMEYMTTC